MKWGVGKAWGSLYPRRSSTLLPLHLGPGETGGQFPQNLENSSLTKGALGNPKLRDSRGLAFARESGLLWQQVVSTWGHCPLPPRQDTHCFPAYMPSSRPVLLGKAGELSLSGRNTSSQQEGRGC